MIKLIPVALATVPVIAFTVTSNSYGGDLYQTGEPETVEPEIASLQSCESTDVALYFHNELIEMHTAEFLGEVIQTASECGDFLVRITPISEYNEDMTIRNYERALNNVEETQAYLEAYDAPYELEHKSNWGVSKDRPYRSGHTVTITVEIQQDQQA